MAKIILSKEINTGTIFFTINAPQAGEKMLFLNPKDGVSVIAEYQNDEGRAYANGICVLLSDGETLRPYMLPLTSITGQSAELVDGTFYPQLKHKTTNAIGRQGEAAVNELCNGGAVCDIEATFPIKINKRNSKEQFSWTTIGIGDPLKETYKSEKGTITFGKATITIEEINKFFNEQNERQNNRL